MLYKLTAKNIQLKYSVWTYNYKDISLSHDQILVQCFKSTRIFCSRVTEGRPQLIFEFIMIKSLVERERLTSDAKNESLGSSLGMEFFKVLFIDVLILVKNQALTLAQSFDKIGKICFWDFKFLNY